MRKSVERRQLHLQQQRPTKNHTVRRRVILALSLLFLAAVTLLGLAWYDHSERAAETARAAA